MIKVFTSGARDFTTNGEVVLLPLKAKVYNEDNGDFYLSLECPINYADYVKDDNIIVCPTPQGEEPFRIVSRTVSNKKIEVRANHVYYDSVNFLIVDSNVENKNGDNAIKWLNNATTPASYFTVSSNVSTVDSYRCVRTSLKEAFDVLVERWGGHLKRHLWNVQLLTTIGVDNGINIEYRKNLEEIRATYDYTEVVTKLLPEGKDGTLLDDLFITADVQYSIPYCKTVQFEQDIDADDYPTEEAYISALKADLRKQANAYINKYKYPMITYELKAQPEKVTDIGDVIFVRDKEIGIELLTNVISYEFDAITGKYTSLEFGNYRKTVKGAIIGLIKKAM